MNFSGGGGIIYNHIGCDIYFLRQWVESKFMEGMSWDNYGEVWIVDHIVPARIFDLFNENDLALCWNYRNLMPMFKCDNLKKEGNIFFAIELLGLVKDKDVIYKSLYNKVITEKNDMLNYINKYINNVNI